MADKDSGGKDKQMKPFRAGSRVVGGPYVPPEGSKKSDSLGFDFIENLIESENFELINEKYKATCGKLEEIITREKDPEIIEKAEAALAAYEKSISLIQELVNIRGAMTEEIKEK